MNLDTIKRGLGRMWTQLHTGSGTEGSDCGCIGACNILCWASKGKVGPKVMEPKQDPQSVANWVRYIRRISGNPTGPMMVRGDIFEALNSQQVKGAFRAANLRPPTVAYMYGIEFWRIRRYLAESPHHAVLLAIHYGVARADGCPVGSESFSGGHIVMFTGAEKRRTLTRLRKFRRFWKSIVGDSLNDGRIRPGGHSRYPKGWLITRLWHYKRAAGRFGTAPDGTPRPIGTGRAVAIFVERYV